MIKSLIVIGIFSSFLVMTLGFGDLFMILLRFKGSFIWICSLVLSPLAVFSILAYIYYSIVHKFLTKL